jgi:hypothetical protein
VDILNLIFDLFVTFLLVFFPLQILDRDLDPEDQDLYSSEEGISQSGRIDKKIQCSLLVCLLTRMVCTSCLKIL